MRTIFIVALITVIALIFVAGITKAHAQLARYSSGRNELKSAAVSRQTETSVFQLTDSRRERHATMRRGDFHRNRFGHREFHRRPRVIFRYYSYPYYYGGNYCGLYPCTAYYPGQAYSIAGSLSVTRIVEMARLGVPDSEIINEIRRTHTIITLNSQLISYMKENGVSDRVIDYLLDSAKTGVF